MTQAARSTARRAAALVALALAGWGAAEWTGLWRAPRSRLAPGAAYAEMPPDARHIYIDLPLDHARPEAGSFRGFYILSPTFDPQGEVVFFLTDGQMELVGTAPDTVFFDAQLPGLSWVIIGHRGHSPTLFPEVFPGGRLDRALALTRYGSRQRVEDIERVRQDMLARGLLPHDAHIMLYGASGAGVLAQEYLARYGRHVSRALLSVTGAPDVAARLGVDYARDFSELEPRLAPELPRLATLNRIPRQDLAYLLYQLGRQSLAGRGAARRVLESLDRGRRFVFWRLWLKPSLNFRLAKLLLSTPAAEAANVRMFELLGTDLRRPREDMHLLYEWAAPLLAGYLSSDLAAPNPTIDRGRFAGEVLVVAARDDVVFSPRVSRELAREYPRSRFVLVDGVHRLSDDADRQARLRRAFLLEGLGAPELRVLPGG